MKCKIVILSVVLCMACAAVHAQSLYSYRNTKKINKVTNEELIAKNQLEYVTFTADRTKCFFSDIDGNNAYGERAFTYKGEENDMYMFCYQDPNDSNSNWKVAFSKDYKLMKSTSSNNPYIKVYDLLEMIRN